MKLKGIDVVKELERQNYTVKKYNSKSVWVLVDDRKLELEQLQHKLSDFGCYHDPNVNGSSLGALMAGGVKVFLKSNGFKDVMTCENAAIGALEHNLANAYLNSTDITIRLDNGKELKNPIGVIKTIGTPKSDFHLINSSGETIHVSHKKGSLPKDFQQWSGMTEDEISTNHYAKKFQREMQRRYSELSSGESIAMRIPDTKRGTELKLMAVYGVDSLSSKESGPNRVDCLLQGNPTLIPQGHGVFRLTTDTNQVYSYPTLPNGNYDPVMALVYKGDRNNMGIRGARASIYPFAGRNFKEVI